MKASAGRITQLWKIKEQNNVNVYPKLNTAYSKLSDSNALKRLKGAVGTGYAVDKTYIVRYGKPKSLIRKGMYSLGS